MNRTTSHTGRTGRARAARPLALLAVLLPLVAGCAASGPSRAAAGDATPTPLPTPIIPEKAVYTVERGTVVQTLEFTGRASPLLQQELYFETAGSVGDVFVSRGAWVQAGDVLAQLDVADLEKQLSQKRLSLETTHLKLEQAQVQATQNITTTLSRLEAARQNLQTARTSAANDLAAARAAVTSAEANLANAKLNLVVVQNSDTVAKNVRDREHEAAWFEAFYGECLQKYEAGQMDKTRLDLEYANLMTAKENLEKARAQAQLALAEAQDRIVQAEESLREAKARVSELQSQPSVSDAEAALEQAELDYEQALADADPESYNMKLMALDLAQVQLDIQDLEDRIASAQLVAPYEGEITSLDLQEGDSVAAYTAVGVLADPRQVEITAQLGSEELSQMALNQQAVIALRNRPGETFHGTVRQLPYPYGGTTIDTGGDDTAVHVSFEGEADLVIGELATVTIVLQEKEDVLWLPPAAIRTYQGRNFCVVQNPDGSQKRVDVLLGIVTEEKAEIAAGLEAGQIVVGE
jgi:multidrug efflux pump subunit AcrA (membrane-fusion protein)